MVQLRVSTVVIATLLITALIFAVVGFTSASNSMVAPAMVTTYMLISAALFGITAVFGLRQSKRWQRFLGVAGVAAALYMLVMGILFFQVLATLEIPEFREPPSVRQQDIAPPTLEVP